MHGVASKNHVSLSRDAAMMAHLLGNPEELQQKICRKKGVLEFV